MEHVPSGYHDRIRFITMGLENQRLNFGYGIVILNLLGKSKYPIKKASSFMSITGSFKFLKSLGSTVLKHLKKNKKTKLMIL
jgi:hypothetical protein